MKTSLTQSEFEQLSAWIDGELSPADDAAVAALVQNDPAWASARAGLSELDAALDSCDVPAAPAGLAQRICDNVRRQSRRSRIIRIAKYFAPAAAAAAVVLAVVLWQGGPKPATSPAGGVIAQADKALKGMNEEDKLAVEAMDFFKDYDVLENYETLQAIDKLESQG